MEETKPEVVAIPEDKSVNSLISQAISQNVPVETLERLFGLREKIKAETAKEEYVKAIGLFQENCPVIEKTKKVLNKDQRTVRYQYAPLDAIVEQIKGPLKASQLSYRWETKSEPGHITAICTVTHVLGHSESSEFSVPIDSEGYMTAPQKVASALTFAKRYSLSNALGISTGDEDDDATTVKKEAEPLSPKSKIVFLLKGLKQDTSTREASDAAVKKLTKLELKEENFEEIVSRLEVLLSEKNEDTIIS